MDVAVAKYPDVDISFFNGKSRSTTVVTAVMCLALKKGVEETLSMIQDRRSMAEPNSNFLKQLKQLHSNGDFNL